MVVRTEAEMVAENERWENDKSTETRNKRAKRAWEETWSNLAASRRNWMVMALSSNAVVALLVVALWHVGTLSKTEVYVLKQSGNSVVYAAPVKPADMNEAGWNEVKVGQLKRFLEAWRTVTSDQSAQQQDWDRAFAFIGDGSQAKKFLSDWYAQNDPIQAADAGHIVTVQYRTYDVEGKNTFGIWWQETKTSLAGTVLEQTSWRARIVFTMHVPTSEKAREQNPWGVLITELEVDPVK